MDTDSAQADGDLIAEGLEEDADGEADRLLWDISSLEEGTYYIYGRISDDLNTATGYAPGTLTVDRTAPLISMSPAGGDYANSVTVTVDDDDALGIYCTIDGTTPTTQSTPYSEPIELTDSATVSCLATDEAGNRSEVASQSYTITAQTNVPPVADAGDDLNITLGQQAFPDGSASHDPDEWPDVMAVSWQFVSVPAGSLLTLADIDDADSLYPSFEPDAVGTYELELTVGDGQESITDRMLVSCTEESGEEIPGDLDGDTDVDGDDFNIFITAYNSCADDPAFLPAADLDDDGCITVNDYRILRSLR